MAKTSLDKVRRSPYSVYDTDISALAVKSSLYNLRHAPQSAKSFTAHRGGARREGKEGVDGRHL